MTMTIAFAAINCSFLKGIPKTNRFFSIGKVTVAYRPACSGLKEIPIRTWDDDGRLVVLLLYCCGYQRVAALNASEDARGGACTTPKSVHAFGA